MRAIETGLTGEALDKLQRAGLTRVDGLSASYNGSPSFVVGRDDPGFPESAQYPRGTWGRENGKLVINLPCGQTWWGEDSNDQQIRSAQKALIANFALRPGAFVPCADTARFDPEHLERRNQDPGWDPEQLQPGAMAMAGVT